MNPRQQLRRLIARSGYTMVPGAYDTLTARLVEAAGFEAVYLTGGGYSRASGYPDLGSIGVLPPSKTLTSAGPATLRPTMRNSSTFCGASTKPTSAPASR